MVGYESFAAQHLDEIRRLCAAEGWTSYADRDATLRTLTAPGCIVDHKQFAGFRIYPRAPK